MENKLLLLQSLDIPNTAFMLICASLVMLMTPGLAFFYDALVPRKSILNMIFLNRIGGHSVVCRRLLVILWSDNQWHRERCFLR